MEKRNLFQKIFGGKEQVNANSSSTMFKLLNDFTPTFYSFNGNLYDSDTVRSTIHAIASNAAKLKPEHIRNKDNKIEKLVGYNYLLQVRPNEYMNTYDFIYKTVSQLLCTNNAFIYIKTEFGRITGLYPINFSDVTLIEKQGILCAEFRFVTGKKIAIPYSELIHLRRHFNEHDFFGSEATGPLVPTLEAINASNAGIVNAVQNSGRLRGIIKFVQSMLKPEDIKKQKDEFVRDYMSINNDGGIAALDSRAEFQPINLDFKTIDDKQMAVIRDNVYRYFNVNENIIMSKYSEDEWNAFYESVIEPIALQLSLEFTSKVFTTNEYAHGNQVIFSANRLQYASATTKISLLRDLMPYGLLTINEGREVFNLAPVEDGDRRLQTLNVVDANSVNQYQGVGGATNEGNENIDK